MLPNETPEICRLCLVKEHVNINIFEDNSQQLFYKITSCLPISIAAEDELPKKICSNCCEKVNMLYEFWNQTLHAQKYLLTWLNDENKFESFSENVDQKFANQTEESEKTYRTFKCDTNGQKNEDFSNNSSPDFWCSNRDESDDCDNSSFHDDNGGADNELNPTQSVVSEKSKASALERLQGSDESNDTMSSSGAPDTGPESPPSPKAKPKAASRRARASSKSAPPSAAKAKSSAAAERAAQLAQPKTEPGTGANDDDDEEAEASAGGGGATTDDEDRAPKPFACAQCAQTFQTAALRVKHEKAAHAKPGEQLFSCDRCSFTTCTKGCLTTHVRRRHVHNYSCDDCKLGFFTKKELTAHNVQQHDVQPFQCAMCNELFVSKSQLYAHIKSHDSSSSYVCEVCGRTYKKKNSYKRHITRSHLGLSTEAQCAVCQRVLSSKDHLRRHMLTHTDERNWVCATCGKCFLSKTYLTEHSRIHLGIRPYKCEICGKCFTQRGSLTIHKRSHTGERPYRCEHCHKGFVMSTLLRYHLRKCQLAKSADAEATRGPLLPAPVATESNPFLCSGPSIMEGGSLKMEAEAAAFAQSAQFGAMNAFAVARAKAAKEAHLGAETRPSAAPDSS